jgi:ribosomal protein S18 acetylase RimI-like enzyme
LSGTSHVALRSVTAADDDLVFWIYASTREDVAAAPWDATERETFLRHQYAAQRADYEARFPDATHSIIVVDDNDVGRIWVDRRPDEIRLLDIALLAEHRNRGLGDELVSALIAEARREDVPLRHSVYKDNAAALRFYARLGFEVVEDFGMYVLMEWTGSRRSAVIPPD